MRSNFWPDEGESLVDSRGTWHRSTDNNLSLPQMRPCKTQDWQRTARMSVHSSVEIASHMNNSSLGTSVNRGHMSLQTYSKTEKHDDVGGPTPSGLPPSGPTTSKPIVCSRSKLPKPHGQAPCKKLVRHAEPRRGQHPPHTASATSLIDLDSQSPCPRLVGSTVWPVSPGKLVVTAGPSPSKPLARHGIYECWDVTTVHIDVPPPTGCHVQLDGEEQPPDHFCFSLLVLAVACLGREISLRVLDDPHHRNPRHW